MSKIKLNKLLRISVHLTVKTGWARRIGQYSIELSTEYANQNYILLLYIDEVRQPLSWLISPLEIKGRLRRGGRIPWDANVKWRIISDGGVFSYLYIDCENLRIGTRKGFNACYPSECMSRKQRREHKQLLAIRRCKRGQNI